MASTYSPNLRLELITTGEQSGTWGTTTNTNLGTLLEQAIGGYQSVAITTGDNTLTAQNGSADQSRNAVLRFSGSLAGATTVNCGLIEKVYIIQNDATGAVTFRANSSDTGISLPSGARKLLYCNGTNVLEAVTDLPSGATVGGAALVSISGSQTLTNKTLTAPVISTISNTGTLTLPTSTDTLVGRATTDTLTNKTLTAPKFADGGFIADANGNELIIMSKIDSAVNEITVTNAITGAGPSISSTGSDSNIDLLLVAKGNGVVKADGVEVVTLSGTQILTNKTLTAPKFADNGFIADANGNELIIMDTVDSAVNELTVANAITGTAPKITASGSDSNISINLVPKGTGKLQYNGTEVATVTAASASGAPNVIIQDVKSSGTVGGTATIGAWTKRTLNTLVYNRDTLATLSNDEFTLPSGTYYIEAAAPFNNNEGFMRIRLYNVTDAAVTAYGRNGNALAGDSPNRPNQIDAVLQTVFTIAATKTLRIEYYTFDSETTSGLGYAQGLSGINEIYTQVNIWKTA